MELDDLVPMFTNFREILDDRNDRREQIYKLSRDITSSSKRVIFNLQRMKSLGTQVDLHIIESTEPYLKMIQARYQAILSHLTDLNPLQYASVISSGNQEFMEALSFLYYLESQTILPYDFILKKFVSFIECDSTESLFSQISLHATPVSSCSSPSTLEKYSLILQLDDYVLGLFDMVGEAMRFFITTLSRVNQDSPSTDSVSGLNQIISGRLRPVLRDFNEFQRHIELLKIPPKSSLRHSFDNKLTVLRRCIDKMEDSIYNLTVRGAEYPVLRIVSSMPCTAGQDDTKPRLM